jgi:aconitate hydratase
MFLPQPVVLGIETTGELPAGTTATDLVLTLTEMLRARGVVGTFVEFFGDGLSSLSVADRATLSNMCPEYGATAAYFPVDDEVLRYLRFTGRGDRVDLVERYTKEQGLFRRDGDDAPRFSETLALDLSSIEPSVAGPRRPQDRVPLPRVASSFTDAFGEIREPALEGVRDGAVVIAAITSCTNTSNPSVMVGAGLMAKKAVEAGLDSKSWVKTSLAPGSRVVTDYLDRAGLTPYLEKLGFDLVGFGCTTCIGNSGPLPDEVASAIDDRDLKVVAVLSGNRNFEGRIHPQVRASYLASPPLVVAYALAGRIDIDLTTEPLGTGGAGPVFLRDIWPSPVEIAEAVRHAITEEQFTHQYARIWDGDERWASLPTPSGPTYAWDPASTYVQEPPFFTDLAPPPVGDIVGACVLVKVGDSITTDHISPAGSIKVDSPAGRYLIDHGVEPRDFNSYGARRGNHEVMMRGTFANIRLRNEVAPGTEGPFTTHLPTGEVLSVFDAAERYRSAGTPLVVLAGKEYGSGSSRDWAAKGPSLLGVRFVVAESYERIHRSNLVGMGVLPLQFADGASAASLGLDGTETYSVHGLASGIEPRQRVQVRADRRDGSSVTFDAVLRVDGRAEVEYVKSGGVLALVVGQMLASP